MRTLSMYTYKKIIITKKKQKKSKKTAQLNKMRAVYFVIEYI